MPQVAMLPIDYAITQVILPDNIRSVWEVSTVDDKQKRYFLQECYNTIKGLETRSSLDRAFSPSIMQFVECLHCEESNSAIGCRPVYDDKSCS
jgi:hypothetical protein